MACSESSYWLAETAVARSCSKPRKLASGRARERTGQTPTGADLFVHPATVMPAVAASITRTQTLGAVGRSHSLTMRDRRLGLCKARIAAVLSRHETKPNRTVAAHRGTLCRARAERLSHPADDQRGLEILRPVPAPRRQHVVDEPAGEGRKPGARRRSRTSRRSPAVFPVVVVLMTSSPSRRVSASCSCLFGTARDLGLWR